MHDRDEAEEGSINSGPAPGAAEVPVLAPRAVIARAHAEPLVDLLRIKLGYPSETFASAVRPVIEGYAGFVQLLPGGPSVHHRRAGGRFLYGLELALRALDRRRGRILPPGALPEVIGAHAHRWTYAVCVAALLHGTVDVVAGLRVLMRLPAEGLRRWEPRAGGLIALGATTYAVTVDECDPQIDLRHRMLPAQVFGACVPRSVHVWLAEDTDLMRELEAWLSGEDCLPGGALAALIAGAVVGASGKARATRPEGVAPPALMPFARPTVDAAVPVKAEAVTSEAAVAMGGASTEGARAFLAWLQAGMADGTVQVNAPGAFVHGVFEGLLLVSPRIFRAFAKDAECDGDVFAGFAHNEPDRAKWIQREVLRPGWHLQAAGGVSMIAYEVNRGDQNISRLVGVVIRDPARFLVPPPVNPALRRVTTTDG